MEIVVSVYVLRCDAICCVIFGLCVETVECTQLRSRSTFFSSTGHSTMADNVSSAIPRFSILPLDRITAFIMQDVFDTCSSLSFTYQYYLVFISLCSKPSALQFCFKLPILFHYPANTPKNTPLKFFTEL